MEFAQPAKKIKLGNQGLQPNTTGHFPDDTYYKCSLLALGKEYRKAVINCSVIKTLKYETAPNSKDWIIKEQPAVLDEVLETPI